MAPTSARIMRNDKIKNNFKRILFFLLAPVQPKRPTKRWFWNLTLSLVDIQNVFNNVEHYLEEQIDLNIHELRRACQWLALFEKYQLTWANVVVALLWDVVDGRQHRQQMRVNSKSMQIFISNPSLSKTTGFSSNQQVVGWSHIERLLAAGRK